MADVAREAAARGPPIRRDGPADNPFAFSPNQLHWLLDGRTASKLRAVGGLPGLCAGLRTDPRAGVSVDEVHLDGSVTFDEALGASHADEHGDSLQHELHRPRTSSTSGGISIEAEPQHAEPRNTQHEQFSDRCRIFGRNHPPKPKQKSFLALVWLAFNDKLMFLLTASAVASMLLGISQVLVSGSEKTSYTGWAESAAIIGAIFVTITATAINDYHKNYRFQKLNRQKEERFVTAIRSGKNYKISVHDIVVGDLLRVEPGEVLPADGVLVGAFRIRCDESHLSGESGAVRKVQADQYNEDSLGDPYLFSGTAVSQGVGTYIVTAVGTKSTSGRIAEALGNDVHKTPLQQRTGRLAKHIIVIGSVIGLLYFTVLLIRWLVHITGPGSSGDARTKGKAFLDIFMLAVTVVIIAVPEGLSLAGAGALAFATMRMLRDHNLVRLLRSCEVMGNTTTVCTDKTGTLTCNEMQVVAGIVGDDGHFGPGTTVPRRGALDQSLVKESLTPANQLTAELARDVRSLLRASITLNSVAYEEEHASPTPFIGSGTETAMLEFARAHLAMGPLAEERFNGTIVDFLPFDPDRKYSATVIKTGNRYRLLVKGAAEIVTSNCVETLVNIRKNWNPREELLPTELTPERREELLAITNGFARRLLRPIAMAYRDLDSWPPIAALGSRDDRNDVQANIDQVFRYQMTFLALFAIHDPLRPGVSDSIRQCQEAGVFVRMVTGDNLVTAEAIALQTGIYTPGGLAMDGPTFRRLTPDQLDAVAPRLQVLARSNADDKARLVLSLKRLGETVAVTGDGTNDAFALKAADVGFSMGISGTEVAKEASSIVLMDDNFASIVKALAWGRTVTEAVKKFCQFQFTLNITAAAITIVSSLIRNRRSSIFDVIQLLWLNLVMDILAGLAFSTDFPASSLLRRPPEPRNMPLINVTMWKMIIGQAAYQLLVVFCLYYAGRGTLFGGSSDEQAQTAVFNAYMLIQLFNQTNCRRVDNNLNVFEGIFENPWFLGIQALTFLGQVLIVFKGGKAFDTEPLTGGQWGWSVVFGFLVLPLGAAIRLIPDRWVAHAGGQIATILRPLKRLGCWCRWRDARKKRRAARLQKQKQEQVQPVEDSGLSPPAPARTRPHWGITSFNKRRHKADFEPSGIALQEMSGPSGNSPELLLTTDTGVADGPIDLLMAVEALRQGSLADAVPGLALHPDTRKDDPILVPPTTSGKPGRIPPSQDPEVMQYITVKKHSL